MNIRSKLCETDVSGKALAADTGTNRRLAPCRSWTDPIGQPAKLRVVKIGGSLLNSSAIEQIPNWLNGQPTMNNVLIVGGGPYVETIRQTQQVMNLSDVDAHWQSIGAMTETAKIVSKRLNPMAPIIDDIRLLTETNVPPIAVLAVESFLRDQCDKDENELPQDWTITSDSIAATIASELRADELVLLKSTLPTDSATVASLAENGFVDEHFPVAFASPRLRIVNARHKDWTDRLLESNTYGDATGRSCDRLSLVRSMTRRFVALNVNWLGSMAPPTSTRNSSIVSIDFVFVSSKTVSESLTSEFIRRRYSI